jgi:protein-disulfide isomerase
MIPRLKQRYLYFLDIIMLERVNNISEKETKEDNVTQTDYVKVPKTTIKWVLAVFVAFVIGIGYGTVVTGMAVSGGVVAVGDNQPAPQDLRATISLEGASILGDENAPVTIVEYSDFQCPFCSRFHEQTLGLIKENYIDTGKVKFAYKHYPIPALGHVSAVIAAEASECAKEQGKFWEYHDILFERQQSDWGYYEQTKGRYLPLESARPFLSRYAQEIGLDVEAFDLCIESGKHQEKIIQDLDDGNSAAQQVAEPGLGTPSFFLNGKLISGAQPYQVFQAEIEAALAG